MNHTIKLLVIFLAVLFAFSLISSSVLADKPEQTGQDKDKEKKQEKDKECDPDENPIMEQSRIQDKDRDRDGDDDSDEDEEQELPPAKGLYKTENNNRNKVEANIQLQNAFQLGATRELIQDEFKMSFQGLEIESPLLDEIITADVYIYITSGISGSKVTTPSGRCNLQAKIYEGSAIVFLTNINEDSPGISLLGMVIEIISGKLNMHSQVGDESENSVDAFFRVKNLEVTDVTDVNVNPFLLDDLITENALIRIRDGKLYFVGSGDLEGNGSPAPPRSNVQITTFARIKSGQ